MMNINIKDLNKYIKFHMRYQLVAFQLSAAADKLGLGGFAHFFQVEAADAFVHTRRIMNYMFMRQISYQVIVPTVECNTEGDDIIALIKKLVVLKEEALALTHELVASSSKTHDFTTVRFYQWYLIDLTEEIEENQQIIDWIKCAPQSLTKLDRKMAKKTEPDVETVQKPFSINAQ